jgi:C-terminal processing protease CtpA/Prc
MSSLQKQRTAILARIKKLVFKRHFNIAGVDLVAWARQIDERTPELLRADRGQFEAGVQETLDRLRSSHTVFYSESAQRVLPQHSINATLRSFPINGNDHWVFLDIFESGPAHVAGIRPGDVLVAVDGTPYVPPVMPAFGIGQAYIFTIANAATEPRREIRVKVPDRKAPKGRLPMIEPKALTHSLIAPGVGLLRVTYFPGGMGLTFAKQLDAAIDDLKRQGIDRLIIDLRGNIGGGLGLARLASYFCPGELPIGYSLTPRRLRMGYDRDKLPRVAMPDTKSKLFLTLARFLVRDKSVMLLTQGLGPQPFHGSVAILVNEFTHSAAEMIASFAAENRLATIIGTKTAGNVLGAANFKVGERYWLRLSIFGWYTSKGKSLEGIGVSPHVSKQADLAALSVGTDNQMNAAVDLVTESCFSRSKEWPPLSNRC